MENIIDNSDVTCCSRCKKSLENISPIYQYEDYLFCSKDCLADLVIENEYLSLKVASILLLDLWLPEIFEDIPHFEKCYFCGKDMTNKSPIYSDQYSNLFCSKNCIADFYMEDQYNCLRDALIDIGADENDD
ncbi:hypothetical protein [Lactobacillus mulieris]|uniref:TRASH domain-containing protein n=1 Tax=Lactobacillus mulieris TaxID=2508708 RepID=A0AAP3GW97_9LACO|nr:hypothetical protein [Lactobacillus mulieris]MCW8123402.1 hypothetical protein [Lactobacillus mulieris]MCZ3844113.1 hypothetical protein [Lactobacillus mulieris]MCZ3875773.1 hypothetical protein [Lactobacillus mulieris]MDK7326565.1 hypothetical protein [Lactobacillus mulieris]WEB30192.1 hypothetical protein PUW59_05420 [Lactobacillus mulieris]